MLTPTDDRTIVHARRVGAVVGALIGLVIGVVASVIAGVLYAVVSSEDDAILAGVWMGVGLFIGTPSW